MKDHTVSLASNLIAFPALCVPRDSGVYLVRDLPELRRSRAQLYWRYHHFEGLRIYDCDERAFEVTGASVSRPASELGRLLARLSKSYNYSRRRDLSDWFGISFRNHLRGAKSD